MVIEKYFVNSVGTLIMIITIIVVVSFPIRPIPIILQQRYLDVEPQPYGSLLWICKPL